MQRIRSANHSLARYLIWLWYETYVNVWLSCCQWLSFDRKRGNKFKTKISLDSILILLNALENLNADKNQDRILVGILTTSILIYSPLFSRSTSLPFTSRLLCISSLLLRQLETQTLGQAIEVISHHSCRPMANLGFWQPLSLCPN